MEIPSPPLCCCRIEHYDKMLFFLIKQARDWGQAWSGGKKHPASDARGPPLIKAHVRGCETYISTDHHRLSPHTWAPQQPDPTHFHFFSKKNPISNFLPILSNKKKEKRGKSPCNSLLQQAACKAETMMKGELSARAKRQPAGRPLPARVSLSVFS